MCVYVPRDWRVVGDQVVVMSDLREPDNNYDDYRLSFRWSASWSALIASAFFGGSHPRWRWTKVRWWIDSSSGGMILSYVESDEWMKSVVFPSSVNGVLYTDTSFAQRVEWVLIRWSVWLVPASVVVQWCRNTHSLSIVWRNQTSNYSSVSPIQRLSLYSIESSLARPKTECRLVSFLLYLYEQRA